LDSLPFDISDAFLDAKRYLVIALASSCDIIMFASIPGTSAKSILIDGNGIPRCGRVTIIFTSFCWLCWKKPINSETLMDVTETGFGVWPVGIRPPAA